VTDKLPFNFMHLGLIAALFPRAAIIQLERHPLDNLVSCYFTSFADEIRFASKLETLARYYLDYKRLMAHWKTVLPIDIPDDSLRINGARPQLRDSPPARPLQSRVARRLSRIS